MSEPRKALKPLTEELAWAFQKWHDAWSGLKDHEGPSVIADIVRYAFEAGRGEAQSDPSSEPSGRAIEAAREATRRADDVGESFLPRRLILAVLRAAYQVDRPAAPPPEKP